MLTFYHINIIKQKLFAGAFYWCVIVQKHRPIVALVPQRYNRVIQFTNITRPRCRYRVRQDHFVAIDIRIQRFAILGHGNFNGISATLDDRIFRFTSANN